MEKNFSSDCVTRGLPLGSTKVMADSVRVKTVRSMGSTTTAVSAFTSWLANASDLIEVESETLLNSLAYVLISVDEVLT